MKKYLLITSMLIFMVPGFTQPKKIFETDIIKTSSGELSITFIGHATLMISCNNTVLHVDPVSQYADYTTMPKADFILVTHEHSDHFDKDVISILRKNNTDLILTNACAPDMGTCTIMKNSDIKTIKDITIEAVPAYNIVHKRKDNTPYHPKGTGNGYVLSIADKRIYIAGDTENIPEMSNLKNIDIAFLPMNLPYTMTPEMVAEAAKRIKPQILYPYHFGNTDTSIITKLLQDENDIEVRIRKMN